MLVNRLYQRAHALFLPLLIVAAGFALGVGMMYHSSSAFAAPGDLNVGAGVGSGTVAGNVYTAGDVTVQTGSSVTWAVQSDEPHTLTFGAGPSGQSPDEWPVAGFTEPPPGPPAPFNYGSVDYAGSGFVNTGVAFGGSTATVHFTTAGNYAYFCAIHPGMAGNVHVVDSGDTTDQGEADAKAAQTTSAILGAVDGLQASTAAKAHGEQRSDGTTLWKIYANAAQDPAPQPGGGTGYLELLRFVPSNVAIKAGDTVQWTATQPHTVTFPAAGQDPSTLDPFTTAPVKPSNNYDGTSLYNSGFLAAGPGAPTTFELTFPKAGVYNYLCLLHGPLGQVGAITVGSGGPVSLPNTGGPPAESGTSPLLPLAGGLLLMAIAGVGVFGMRRLRDN